MGLSFMREAEDMLPFLRSLPKASFIRRYCSYAVMQTDAPLAYHVAMAHALLSSCCSPDLLYWFAGQQVHPALWTLLVGMSRRDRKSTAISIARRMFRAVTPERYGEHPASTSAFLEGMAAQPQRTYVYGEMGTLLKMTGDGRQLSDLRIKYMEAFDGSPLNAAVVAARGGGRGAAAPAASRSVEFPKMSLWGGIAPILLENYTTDVDWTGGFMNRQTITWAGRERDAPFGSLGVSPVTEESLIAQLGEIAGRIPGVCRGLDPAASKRWCEWYIDVTNRYAGDFAHEAAIGAANGLPPTVLKLAVLHELDYGGRLVLEGDWQIGAACLDAAIGYGEQLLLSQIHTTNAVATTGYARIRRCVYDACAPREEAPGVPGEWRSLGDIMRRVRPPQPKMTVANCLADLELERLIAKRTSNQHQDVWRRVNAPAVGAATAAAAAEEEEAAAASASGEELL